MSRRATDLEKATAVASKAATDDGAIAGPTGAQGGYWVNGISYWQDYMTIIELEQSEAPGLRPAS